MTDKLARPVPVSLNGSFVTLLEQPGYTRKTFYIDMNGNVWQYNGDGFSYVEMKDLRPSPKEYIRQKRQKRHGGIKKHTG